ncbi:MAG: EF-hand domain-containing protein [Caulobacter sp.]|nr:EF-hand domain-containing protein [Caulobacter sp.]
MKTFTLAAVLLTLTAGAAGSALAQGAGARGDTNGDGKISLAEFKAARVAMTMRSDANKDGKISKAELEAGIIAMQAARGGGAGKGGGGRSGQMFDMMDANKDGFLTRPEIEKMVERRFQRMDVNGDGVLTTAEQQAGRRGPMGGQGAGER